MLASSLSGDRATATPSSPSSAGVGVSTPIRPRRFSDGGLAGTPRSEDVYEDSSAELLRLRDELLRLRETRRLADIKRAEEMTKPTAVTLDGEAAHVAASP